MITSDLLKTIAPQTSSRLRDRFIEPLNRFCPQYGIDNYLRICAFLATGGIESDYFKVLSEYASGADYEHRADLGNTQSGDGRKFKGRGFFQTTGRSNYARLNQTIGKKTGIDFLRNPERLAEIAVAVESACIFWKDNNLEKYADSGDFKNLNSIVNCGKPNRQPNQWSKRNDLYSLCLRRIPKDFGFDSAAVNSAAKLAADDTADDTADETKDTDTKVSPLRDLGNTILVHCPKDSVQNIFVVIGTRILSGVAVLWGIGLRGQIFLIVAASVFVLVFAYAVYRYSDRAIAGAKRLIEYFFKDFSNMNLIIAILMILAGVLPAVGDVHSTSLNNDNPHVREQNEYFRRDDGHCYIPKLILWKLLLLGSGLSAAIALYTTANAGLWSFIFFPLIGAVTLPAVIKNYRIYFQERKP